jgi:hypothetical protein
MRTFATKLLTFALALSMLGSAVLPASVHFAPRAQAQVVAFTQEQPGPLLAAVLETAFADTTTAGATTLQATIMQFLNSLAWTVAKTAVQSVTRSIVTWINSGFEGEPAFVSDLNRNLRNLSDAVAMDFFANLDAGVIDSPFLEQVAVGVGAAYYFNSSQDRISRRLRYTLNEYSRNDRAFLDGDFSQGGFNAWLATWTTQANNPIGAHYIVGQELAAEIEAQSFERLQELMYGRGFMSWKGECTVRDETISLDPAENCIKHDTLTPGVVIERQLGITLESPLRQLELADSINEIVAALAVQMVTQVAGASGLLGTTRPSSGGGGSSLDRATNPNQFSGATTGIGQGLSSRMAGDRANVRKFEVAWTRIQGAALQAQQALQSGRTCTDREAREVLVNQTLSDANAAVARAQEAGSSLDALIANITQAASNADALNTAGNAYLALLSSGDIPDTGQIRSAETQASNTGSQNPGSLYSQMMRIAQECGT